MPDIVQQGGGKNHGVLVVVNTRWAEPGDAVKESPCNLHDANRMHEPAVIGPWKNQLAEPQLFDSSKALKLA